MPWAVAAAAVSAGIGAAASSKASKAQAKSADAATELQREQFDKQVELQEPFRQGGVAANSRLMTLLGLKGPTNELAGGKKALTADQIRDELRTQYARPGTADAAPVGGSGWSADSAYNGVGYEGGGGPGESRFNALAGGAAGTGTDDAALEAAVQARLATQEQEMGAANAAAESDPEFGSLMRDFSMQDYQEDPGYQFRLAEGQKGLQRSAAAKGGLLSGAAMKDMEAYSQGMGAQEYQAAFNRFQVNRSNKLNPLQAMAGQGQTATNALTSASQNYASNAGNTMMQAGNARASGYMGAANAVAGGVGQAINGYQQNQLMDKVWGPTGSAGTSDAWRNTGNGMPSYWS